ncbi:MAG: FecR domain-containing protein [Betaproteobacteria bacterium]|nr:FecR domain-containing protein [Betaproteobacteria bacterium]
MNRTLRYFNRVALVALLVAASVASTWATAQTVVGRILVAAGDVQLQRAGRVQQALTGAALHTGDVVRTGANANAQLLFADESMVALRHGSEFAIDRFRFQNREESDELAFRLTRGGLRTLTGQIGARRPDGYRVITPLATLGKRGTQYAIVLCQDDCAAEGGANGGTGSRIDNGLYGGVFDGVVTLTNNAGVSEFSYGQYFFVRDLNSIPQPLLGPPAVLADRLLGQGKGVAPQAPPAQETAQQQQQQQPPAAGDPNAPAAAQGNQQGQAAAGAPPASGNASQQPAPSGSTASTSPPPTSQGTTSSAPSPATNMVLPGLAGSTATAGTNTSPSANIVTPPVVPYTGTTTLGSGGTSAVVPSGAAPTPTLGLSVGWFIPPPIIYLEDAWGRTSFAPPANLQLSGSGASERLTGFTMALANTLNVGAQVTVSETLTASLALGTLDMMGYDGAANVHWGRWVNGQLFKSNKPPGAHMPLSGVHYIYGNPTPDTVIAAKSGSFNFSDIGGTIATDSFGATGTGGFGAINVNFTSRTGSISTVNYTFPTATYNFSNLPFAITVIPGVGAWMGADLVGVGSCTGSGCSTPGGAHAVFNGIFFGSAGNFLGLTFHGSSAGVASGFTVARLFKCSGCP